MTRRTYYLPEAAAVALDEAVEKIRTGTGGRTSKHEALAALIAAGVAQTQTVTADLKAALLRDLNGA